MINTPISLLDSNSLGLERDGRIRLLPHNPRWKREFSNEAHRIFEALKTPELRFFHIGSTAIPGIHAKPIIDILISTPSHELLDLKKTLFEGIGYDYKGEYGIPGRRYAVLYNQEKNKGYVHLHAFEDSHPEIERHLIFRDFLRQHPNHAQKYESLKFDLVGNQKVSRSDYTGMKAPLINEILSEAFSWKKSYKPRRLIVVGSAEGGSQTEKWLASLKDFENYEILKLHEYDLSQYKYDGEYPSTDSFLAIVDKVLRADLITFASPIYWYAVSGHLKLFLDRFSDLISKNKELGKQLYGKAVELFATGSDREAPIGFDVPINLTALYFGMDYLGMKYKCTGDKQ